HSFRTFEQSLRYGTIGEAVMHIASEGRHHTGRCHALDVVVAAVSDIEDARGVEGEPLRLFETSLRADESGDAAVVGDGPDGVISGVGDVDDLARLVDGDAGRFFELRSGSAAIGE